MSLFDRINSILRSRMMNDSPVQNVDDQIVGAEVFPQSQEEEAQARFGVPDDFVDDVTLLKERHLKRLLNEMGAEEPLPQDVKGL